MSDFKGKRCDGDKCEQIKKESNHWHQVRLLGESGHNWVELGDIPNHESYAAAADAVTLDFCSERCLIGYVSRFIGQEQTK